METPSSDYTYDGVAFEQDSQPNIHRSRSSGYVDHLEEQERRESYERKHQPKLDHGSEQTPRTNHRSTSPKIAILDAGIDSTSDPYDDKACHGTTLRELMSSRSQKELDQMQGYDSDLIGLYEQYDLARYRRRLHTEFIDGYRCESPNCGRGFQSKDFRLKHHKKQHPELAVAPVPTQRQLEPLTMKDLDLDPIPQTDISDRDIQQKMSKVGEMLGKLPASGIPDSLFAPSGCKYNLGDVIPAAEQDWQDHHDDHNVHSTAQAAAPCSP